MTKCIKSDGALRSFHRVILSENDSAKRFCQSRSEFVFLFPYDTQIIEKCPMHWLHPKFISEGAVPCSNYLREKLHFLALNKGRESWVRSFLDRLPKGRVL